MTTYIQRGKSPKYSPIKEYPVVAQKCNQWSGFSLELAKFVDPATVSSYAEERILQDGDLLWNSTGLGTLGRMAVYDSSVNEYGWAVADSHVTVIRTLPGWLDYRYAFAYFAGPSVQSVIEVRASGSTKQKELAQDTVRSYLIPIPPRTEQKRIVKRITSLNPLVDDYGALEDARERLDADLPDRLRKSILQLAVQGKLVEQEPADEPASVLLDRIRAERAALMKAGKLKAPRGGESVIYRSSDGGYYEKRGKSDPVCIDDEIPFEIPESWAWARVKDFGFFSSGKTPSKHDQSLYGGNHLWVTSKDMKSFKIVQTGITLSDKGSEGLNTYPVGTVLFVVRSGILKRFLPIAILDRPATINQDIKALMLYDSSIAVGLAYFIKAFEPYILEELTKSVTTVDSLRFDEFQDMLIPVPPEAEWNRIVAQLDIALSDVITNQ